MTPRPRGLGKREAETSALVEALRFISLAQKSDAKAFPCQHHCIMENNAVIGFDGNMAMCARIEENVSICPETFKFIDALIRCGQSFQLTQLDNNKIKIANAKFGVHVDCMARGDLPSIAPDPNIAPANDELKVALATVCSLANDKAEKFVETTVLVKAGSVAATNLFVMLEYWHGIDLPTMTLPKATAVALTKIKKPLVGFGYGGNSATFHFDDGSWLRTQLHSQAYPDIGRVLDKQSNAWPLPPNFYEAVRALEPFTNEQGTILFSQNALRTHSQEQTGAVHEVIGIPQNLRFKAKHLLLAEPHIKKIDFLGKDGIALFFGDKVRGAITQVAKSHEELMAEYRASPEYAAREEARKASEDERRAKWEAEQAAKPWYPGKDKETFEDQDIPF